MYASSLAPLLLDSMQHAAAAQEWDAFVNSHSMHAVQGTSNLGQGTSHCQVGIGMGKHQIQRRKAVLPLR